MWLASKIVHVPLFFHRQGIRNATKSAVKWLCSWTRAPFSPISPSLNTRLICLVFPGGLLVLSLECWYIFLSKVLAAVTNISRSQWLDTKCMFHYSKSKVNVPYWGALLGCCPPNGDLKTWVILSWIPLSRKPTIFKITHQGVMEGEEKEGLCESFLCARSENTHMAPA